MDRKTIKHSEVIQSESFELFFADKLDKKLQYADRDELAVFVFGSLQRAVRAFMKEKEDWEVLIRRPSS